MATHIQTQALNHIPADVVSVSDYERLATEFIRRDILEYINGGVADDHTLLANRHAFNHLSLYNRISANFSNASTQLELFGRTQTHPLLLSPVAHQQLVHPEGELATAEAARAMNTPMIISTLSNTPLKEIAQKAKRSWFQLYWQPHREANARLIEAAERAGCEAIVITLDAPVNGLRNRAQRAGFQLPTGVEEVNLTGLPQAPVQALNIGDSIVLKGFMADAPSMEDLHWLRQQTTLPLLAKGISHPADAKQLIQLGFNGLIISNHGGRTLDTLPASIDLLPAIRQAIGNDIPLLLDSGIRRGTDVIKALALGANAVCIGRPQMWGLAVAGALGVAHCIKILQQEIEITMALCGCPTLDDISEDVFFKHSDIKQESIKEGNL
ncbi:MAG: alpha-hydroxy acid oxidase [Oleibacter sp.]|nr:alpha-hydroxy acid oxidase [Thalassolituus sp.]